MTTHQTIKPIETKYKGYRFRSRLEARWAVFFDALGIEWQYEIEGFDLGAAGWYLPDFWLPEFNAYVEVKPTFEAVSVDAQKYYSLSGIYPLIVVMGLPNQREDGKWSDKYGLLFDGNVAYSFRFAFTDYVFGVANYGGGWHAWKAGWKWDIAISEKLDEVSKTIVMLMCENSTILRALDDARQARFEYNETPLMRG